jgi:hypothetical protein
MILPTPSAGGPGEFTRLRAHASVTTLVGSGSIGGGGDFDEHIVSTELRYGHELDVNDVGRAEGIERRSFHSCGDFYRRHREPSRIREARAEHWQTA